MEDEYVRIHSDYWRAINTRVEFAERRLSHHEAKYADLVAAAKEVRVAVRAIRANTDDDSMVVAYTLLGIASTRVEDALAALEEATND